MTSPTIPGVAMDAASKWPNNTAIVDAGVSLSFSELASSARQHARAFMAAGLKKGQCFSIWAPNILEWVLVALGGQMAGGVLVPINTRNKGAETGDILRRSKSKWLFTVNDFLNTDYPAMLTGENLPGLKQTVLLRGDAENCQTLAQFLSLADDVDEAELELRFASLTGDDLSDIMYTSGTTGAPKGVMSSHGQVVRTFSAWSQAVGLDSDDRYLIVNPFFHTFGYKSGWLCCLLTGALALPEAIFDGEAILGRIQNEKVTMLPGAPTIFQSLLNHENRDQYDLSSLRCAVTGAASVPVQLVRDMKHVLGFDAVYTGYGLTECGVVSICREGDDFETIANTAGRPIDGIEVKVVDDNDQKVEPDATGYIKVRGFNVMQGYFEDPDATAKTISESGWLDTGDIGWQNSDGYLKITDRAKDLYICGGFNCYPAEIENLLLQHPDIIDVAVVGRTDARLGEVGHAVVVMREQTLTSSDELIKWARQHMANYKVPRSVTFAKTLPRNPSGKVQKFLLETT